MKLNRAANAADADRSSSFQSGKLQLNHGINQSIKKKRQLPPESTIWSHENSHGPLQDKALRESPLEKV